MSDGMCIPVPLNVRDAILKWDGVYIAVLCPTEIVFDRIKMDFLPILVAWRFPDFKYKKWDEGFHMSHWNWLRFN